MNPAKDMHSKSPAALNHFLRANVKSAGEGAARGHTGRRALLLSAASAVRQASAAVLLHPESGIVSQMQNKESSRLRALQPDSAICSASTLTFQGSPGLQGEPSQCET